jgi:hypothetical protein
VDRFAWRSDAKQLVAKVIKCTHCPPEMDQLGEVEISLETFRKAFEAKQFTIVESATEVQDKGILQITGRATQQKGWLEEIAKARLLLSLSAAAYVSKPPRDDPFPFTLHTKPKRKVFCFLVVS